MAMLENFEKETQVFEAHLEEWRRTQMGRFVLIKEQEVVGFYSTLTEAFADGTKRFGLQNFFIKQITPQNTVNVSLLGKHLRTA